MDKNTSYTHSAVGLTAVEAGWILQKTEGEVRGMLRRGELRHTATGRKIDPEAVRRLAVGPYKEDALDALLEGVIKAPRPETRYGRPEPMVPVFHPGFWMQAAIIDIFLTALSRVR